MATLDNDLYVRPISHGPRGPADRKAPPMAYAKTSLRKEKRELREKMRAMGLDYRDIAAEFTRRYRLRPRAAWRKPTAGACKRPPTGSTSSAGTSAWTPAASPG